MGSPNEFGWLFTANVTSHWQATESRCEIPAALWRLGFSSLPAQKNFDYAQDDMLLSCFVEILFLLSVPNNFLD